MKLIDADKLIKYINRIGSILRAYGFSKEYDLLMLAREFLMLWINDNLIGEDVNENGQKNT